MEERLKMLRKRLNLTQEEFGKRIGVKASAIGQIEKGRNNLSARNIDAICREFNVNPDWLSDGEGKMFNEPPEKSFLEQLAAEKGLNAREVALIQSIIDLPASVRGAVIEWAIDLARTIGEETPEERELRKLDEEQRRIDERRRELIGNTSLAEESSGEVG